VAGQWIVRLDEGRKADGYHDVIWDGRNSSGGTVASGIYLARLRAGKKTKVTKLVLTR
jgi:flagellar hook assembly protein FlgD